MPQTALILGATGRFGHNAAQAFQSSGWNIRRFNRKHDALLQAAQGADVIVNGWNPPYPDWAQQVPERHTEVIAAAEATGATVIVPGNVYVFGGDTPGPWSETTPHLATNPLGRIRIDMEEAYRASSARTILLRAGDFIDTCNSGNWFDQIMIKHLLRGRFTYPGNAELEHAWAYLPDLARAAVALAENRHELPHYSDVPFPGYTLSGEQIAASLAEITGRAIRLKRMDWVPIQVARPLWSLAAPLLEMRYLWETPHQLDGTYFAELLPDFQHTGITEALRSAISGSGKHQVNPDQSVTTPTIRGSACS